VIMFSGGTPTGFAPGTAFARTLSQAIIRNVGALLDLSDGTTRIDGVAYLVGEDNPDVDGFTNMGVSSIAGGSVGRRPDGVNSFRAFAPGDANRPTTPCASNNAASGIPARNWQIYAD